MSELSKERQSFREVLYNGDDQVTVRNLIVELVPEKTKEEILARFNKSVRERNARIIAMRWPKEA